MSADENQPSEMFKGLLKAGADAIGQKSKEAVEYLAKPENLAEVVIKATAAQEKVNAYLRGKRSVYRIGEVQITAGLPPEITFSVVRSDEGGVDSSSLTAEGGEPG